MTIALPPTHEIHERLAHGRTAAFNNDGMVAMSNSRAAVSRRFQSRRGNNRRHVGNVLPRVSTQDVTQGQAEVLRGIYGPLKSAAKVLAEDAGTSERAARNHLGGQNAMNLADFFNACRAIPELRAWGVMMMGLQASLDPAFAEELAKGARTITLRIEGEGVTLKGGGE